MRYLYDDLQRLSVNRKIYKNNKTPSCYCYSKMNRKTAKKWP